MEKITAKQIKNLTEFSATTVKDKHVHGFVYTIDHSHGNCHKITVSSWTGFISKHLFCSKKEVAAFLNGIFSTEKYENVSFRYMCA
jgi:hypothetical protein